MAILKALSQYKRERKEKYEVAKENFFDYLDRKYSFPHRYDYYLNATPQTKRMFDMDFYKEALGFLLFPYRDWNKKCR